MKKFILPDFKHCNLNISATLAEFLGAPNGNATLPILKTELDKNYKNVVFICFDGMGIYPLERNLPETDYLRKNTVAVLKSTFPSTTTCATTSLTTNRLPLEHGWFGWSMYFEKLDRNVLIFLDADAQTGEPVDVQDCSPLERFPFYFDEATNTEYRINTVFPPYVNVARPDRNTVWNLDMGEFFEDIKSICAKDGKQFVYAYNNEPDRSMHEYGVTCPKTKELLQDISRRLQQLVCETSDTLFIVTADHGQIDVEGNVNLYEDEKLYGMLETKPYMEPRAIAFKVKSDKKKEFCKYFTSKYGRDFKLTESKKLVKRGFFGDIGNKEYLLGDYIAIGTYTHKQALFFPADGFVFKGHHTSLTEEMLVPLILIPKK
ncbi:MAG: alkaline phosphatase family protein [Corallococcus sp.]|nr:alkaline phosphatase family protein [Corallococcus sp.]